MLHHRQCMLTGTKVLIPVEIWIITALGGLVEIFCGYVQDALYLQTCSPKTLWIQDTICTFCSGINMENGFENCPLNSIVYRLMAFVLCFGTLWEIVFLVCCGYSDNILQTSSRDKYVDHVWKPSSNNNISQSYGPCLICYPFQKVQQMTHISTWSMLSHLETYIENEYFTELWPLLHLIPSSSQREPVPGALYTIAATSESHKPQNSL